MLRRQKGYGFQNFTYLFSEGSLPECMSLLKKMTVTQRKFKKKNTQRNTILFVIYQEKLQNLGQFPTKIKLEKLQKEK